MREESFDAIKNEVHAVDAFAKHPELTGPQSLAVSFKDIFEGVSTFKAEDGFTKNELAQIASSSHYTEQERAAAELVKANFDKFATLGDKEATTFSVYDVVGLAKIGLPAGVNFPGDGCQKSNPVTNAVGYAVATGVVSKALGSKQSFANAMVAGTSAAIASEVKNKISCGDN